METQCSPKNLLGMTKKGPINRGEKGIRKGRRNSPHNSSKRVIDREKNMWHFNPAIRGKGSKHVQKTDID
jgi:hypothetical protein